MKKRCGVVSTAVAAIALAGCAAMPQNAGEYRALVGGKSTLGVSITKETTMVNRGFSDVVASIDKYFERCFAVSIRSSDSGGSYKHTITPRVQIGENSAEFTLQSKWSNVIGLSKAPDGGLYTNVFDVYPADDGTAIDSVRARGFGQKKGVPVMAEKAVLGWASSNVRGCPDLTKA